MEGEELTSGSVDFFFLGSPKRDRGGERTWVNGVGCVGGDLNTFTGGVQDRRCA